MFKKILSTTATRVFTAFISLWVLFLNARILGPEGIGTIGIIVLDISIISLVNGLLGSSSLSYFVSRKPIKHLLTTSFLSILIGSALVVVIGWILRFFTEIYYKIFLEGYFTHILVLSALQSLYANNMAILIGKERIFQHNLLTICQFTCLISSILLLYNTIETPTVYHYISAFYFSILTPLILSSIQIVKWIKKEQTKPRPKRLTQEVFQFGWAVQLASLIQMLNYRIPYYFLNLPSNQKSLGVYTTSNQLAEGLWIFGKSVSLVQYARISNSDDTNYNQELTLRLFKFASIITALALLLVVLIPDEWFVFFLKHEEYQAIPKVILLLSPGILALVMKMILAHYFSGTGRPRINLRASAFSLIAAIISASILIPAYHIEGAAISASITYFFGALILIILFLKESPYSLLSFLPSREDYQFLRAFIQEFRKKQPTE